MQRSQIAGFIPTTEKRLTPHVGRAQWTERSTVQTHKFSFQLGTGVRPPSPGVGDGKADALASLSTDC